LGDDFQSVLQPFDLENFQGKQKAKGFSDSYLDQQISAGRTMIIKAFDQQSGQWRYTYSKYLPANKKGVSRMSANPFILFMVPKPGFEPGQAYAH
jgi:hypothetical protein